MADTPAPPVILMPPAQVQTLQRSVQKVSLLTFALGLAGGYVACRLLGRR